MDILMMQGLLFSIYSDGITMKFYVVATVTHLIVKIMELIILYKICEKQVLCAKAIVYISVLVSIVVFVIIGPVYTNLI